MSEFDLFSEAVVNLALTLPRIAAAFLVLPLLTSEIVPALARNIFLMSLAIAVFPFVAHDVQAVAASGVMLGPVVIKELFIGVVIGYAFSIVFWALEGAGQVIDTKVGTTMAQITDPLSGHQTSLIGALLSQLAGYLFVAFGGLLIFLDLLLTSYSVWPLAAPLPDLAAAGQLFFIQRFDELMRLILLLAAPALVVLTLIDFGLGFVNRYAQQLNVFSLSLSIKAWLGVFIVLLMLTSIVEFMLGWLADQQGLLEALRLVL
ncbi:MAG: type III secretion system export apparatus subunit SctT [Pseudomonadales bacterium]